MKNLFQCAILLIAFIIPITSQATSISPIKGNWISPMPDNHNFPFAGDRIYIHLDENEDLHVNLTATMTDFQLNLYDNVYIGWEFGNYTGVVGPITPGDLVSIGEGFYEATFERTINFQTECNLHPSGIFAIEIALTLLKDSGEAFQPFEPYPLESNPGLFNPLRYDELTNIFVTGKSLLCDGVLPPEATNPNSQDIIAANYNINTTNKATQKGVIENLSAYPNPFTDEFNISYQLKETTDVQIRLLDFSGKQIAVQNHSGQVSGLHETTFSMGSHLPPGIYTVQCYLRDDVKNIKLVKSSNK